MVADRLIRNRLSGPVIMNIPGQAPPLGCGTQPAVSLPPSSGPPGPGGGDRPPFFPAQLPPGMPPPPGARPPILPPPNLLQQAPPSSLPGPPPGSAPQMDPRPPVQPGSGDEGILPRAHNMGPPGAPNMGPPGAPPNMGPPGAPNMGPPGAPNVGPPSAPNVGPPGAPNVGPPGAPNVGPPGAPNVGPPGAPNVGPPGAPNVGPPGAPNVGPPGAPNVGPPGAPNMGPPGTTGEGGGGGGKSPISASQTEGAVDKGNVLTRQSSHDGPSQALLPPPAVRPPGPPPFPNMPPGHVGPPRPGLLPPPRPNLNAGQPPGELNRPPIFGGPRPDFKGGPGGPIPPGGDGSRPPGPPPGEIRPRPPGMDPRFRGQGFPPGNRPPAMGFPNGPRPLMRAPPFPFPQGPPPGGEFPPQEVWFEHATAEGKVYYSNAQTQNTTWERPQNARVVSPAPGPRGVQEQVSRPPLFPPGFPPPTLPGNPQLVPTRVWSDHQTPEGKVYFYNKVTKQSMWERPKDYELIMPLPISFSNPPPAVEQKSAASEQSEKVEESRSTGEKEGAVPEKGVATAAGGNKEKKSGSEMEISSSEEGAKPSSVPNQPQAGVLGPVPNPLPLLPQINLPPQPAGPQSLPLNPPPGPTPAAASLLQPQPTQLLPGAQQQQSILEAPIPASVLSLTPKERPAGPRPVATSAVPGTPWSIVWSSDDRMFFFNATTRASVWSVPSELVGNQDVERMLDNPPPGKKRPGGMRGGPEAKRRRLSDSDISDEEEEEEGMEIEGVALVGGDAGAGLTAEQRAAEARANKPLEERQRIFKEMLLERGVSAFSTWEKELPKFVFDPRYLLLTQKERKACFQAFIRSRTEEERRERKNQLKEMKEKFRSLLEGAKLHSKSSFSEFASKYGKDERFKAVEKMRDREQMFSDYLSELKKGGGGSKQREDHKTLASAASSSAKSKTDKARQEFLAMLAESRQEFTENSQWRKVKGSFDHDPRYKAVESEKREELFKEHVKGLNDHPQEAGPIEQTREERIQASLKERERQVQESRTAQEKEWGRERDQLKKMEAQQDFKTLLVDMVKLPEMQWHEAKRNMKRDSRWEMSRLLDHSEREQMYQAHVLELANKKRLHFRKLLEETSQITLDMSWRKARKLIRDDPRYKTFTDSDHKREVEFDKYQSDKLSRAKNDFHSLLKETKFITYKSRELVRESDRHYKDIIDLLKNDKRYLVLDCVPEDRKEILHSFLDELHRKGPPPPPTATHPGERLKRPSVPVQQ